MKIKCNKKNLGHIAGLIILLFPFIQQRTYLDMPSIFGIIYKTASIAVSLVISLRALLKYKFLLKQKYLVLFLFFWCTYVITTFCHSRKYTLYVAWHAFIFLALVLLMSIETRRNLSNLLSALSFIYGVFIYLNFFTDILFPNGLYSTSNYHAAHLLGDDNALIYVMLPGIICMTCNSLQKYNKIKWYVWLAVIISEITLIYLWTASALVVMTLFIFLTLYTLKFGRLNPNILLLGVVAAILICLFGLTSTPVQTFLVDVLHKDVTLHDRTYLWAMAFELIVLHPVFGTGGYFQNGLFQLSQYSSVLYPCHTTYLQLLIDGGFILFGIFAVITFVGYKEVSSRKSCMSSYILAIGLSCMLINYITEYSELYHYFIIVMLMINSKYFHDEEIKISFKNLFRLRKK